MKIKAIYLYGLFILWAILLGILIRFSHLNLTGLGVILTFLTFILSPGIMLYRLLRLQSSAKILYIIGLGFGFYFLFNLLGMLFGLTIDQVLLVTGAAAIVIFLLSGFFDRNEVLQIDFSWAKKPWYEWLLIATAIIFSIVAFFAVDAQSDKLIGDGWFHLAILEKIVTGMTLKPDNFSPVKGAAVNLVYAFPIWHILVGELAKIMNISVYQALRLSMLPLVLIDFIAIYYVGKVFFAKFELTILSYLMFLNLLLLGNFYFLVSIVSPDGLVRMLFFPLITGLSVAFIFTEEEFKFKEPLVISFLIVFMGLIHFTQMVEFILVLTIFLFVAMISYRKERVLSRGSALWLLIFILIVPYLAIFQRENLASFIHGNMVNFVNVQIVESQKIIVLYFYSILIIPLMILFSKKTPRLFWLIISLLILILIAWPQFGLQNLFLKYLGQIFTLRAASDVFAWLYWGFGAYLILWLFNIVFTKIGPSKIFLINIGLVILVILGFLVAPLRNSLIYLSSEIIFNEINRLNNFLFHNFWLIIIMAIIITLVIYLVGKYSYKIKDWVIPEPKIRSNFAVLVAILIVVLALPYLGGLKEVYAKNPNGNLFSDRSKNLPSDISVLGGQETIDFLQTLPNGSIFAVSTPTIAQNILLYGNFYVVEYPYGISEFEISQRIFRTDTTQAERLVLLNEYRVDYILTSRKGEAEIFDEDPLNFLKVYQKSFTFLVVDKKMNYLQNRTLTIYRYLGKDRP